MRTRDELSQRGEPNTAQQIAVMQVPKTVVSFSAGIGRFLRKLVARLDPFITTGAAILAMPQVNVAIENSGKFHGCRKRHGSGWATLRLGPQRFNLFVVGTDGDPLDDRRQPASVRAIAAGSGEINSNQCLRPSLKSLILSFL
ncbi:hypothetical protein [Burkholderia alba]|uniref:hypothetical protein n=1 Tax=Burkholderia alba TaxID=2683677 RepID=UPI002B060C74|nr:hypothetical protein [Burkholderia alba]